MYQNFPGTTHALWLVPPKPLAKAEDRFYKDLSERGLLQSGLPARRGAGSADDEGRMQNRRRGRSRAVLQLGHDGAGRRQQVAAAVFEMAVFVHTGTMPFRGARRNQPRLKALR